MSWRAFVLLTLAVMTMISPAAAFMDGSPQKRGIGVNLGLSHNPDPNFVFAQISIMALYDYEQVFSHRAPEPLRFKIEGSAGLADREDGRFQGSGNILALYYLPWLKGTSFSPYAEAGIGLVYTDYQVDDQGLRLNFNPQAGIGSEWRDGSGTSWYGAFRVYHLSNGNLHKDNKGINAVMLQFGRMF